MQFIMNNLMHVSDVGSTNRLQTAQEGRERKDQMVMKIQSNRRHNKDKQNAEAEKN